MRDIVRVSHSFDALSSVKIKLFSDAIFFPSDIPIPGISSSVHSVICCPDSSGWDTNCTTEWDIDDYYKEYSSGEYSYEDPVFSEEYSYEDPLFSEEYSYEDEFNREYTVDH